MPRCKIKNNDSKVNKKWRRIFETLDKIREQNRGRCFMKTINNEDGTQTILMSAAPIE